MVVIGRALSNSLKGSDFGAHLQDFESIRGEGW